MLFLFPDIITSPLLLIVTESLSNVALYPAAQSCPMESSDPVCSWGSTWAAVALADNCGRSIVAECDELIVSPFGSVTETVVFLVLFKHGASGVR